MSQTIQRAAVIGSGVMGASIAAHLSNAGIPTLLLDLVPKELTEKEKERGLDVTDVSVRNRLATTAIEKLKKVNPAPFYDNKTAALITPGNIEDDLARIKEVDWVIEVVVENLAIKQSLYQQIERVWEPGTIVSSNTSGISINEMVSECGEEFKSHFLGTHFFNPPRYMKLLEVIPGEHTEPSVITTMQQFCEKQLGKKVVIAKDTPNFIANRIGTHGMLITLAEMLDKGYTIEEVDAVTGPAMGRPRSATFRTLDLVGIDTFYFVSNNMYEKLSDPAEKKLFKVPQLLEDVVANGWIGEKAGQGFYKKEKTSKGKQILSLNLSTYEYEEQSKPKGASLDASKAAKGAANKLKALMNGKDQYAEMAWNILKHTLIYSAEKVGEIADTIVEIDEAMKWGFNWELGPFETWDAIGLKSSVDRMEQEGLQIPAWVTEWIENGNESFYNKEQGSVFYYSDGAFNQLEQPPEEINLHALKAQNKTIIQNNGASLIDLGEGVACLEFHSPNNAIGADILTMIQQSMDEVRKNFNGMVIANQGRNFCVGANIMILLMEAQEEEWDEVDQIIRMFQQTMLSLKHFEKPVVAAPHRMALGGGVEVCLPADHITASAETYFGLVEAGVGLIPAGGGCKEYMLRLSSAFEKTEVDIQPEVNRLFETIATAKVSTSADDAKRLGYLRASDQVILNESHVIYEAKQAALRLATQPASAHHHSFDFQVPGREGKAVMQLGAMQMRLGGYASDHDVVIANKLAHVLAGGDVPPGTLVSEQYMLDLEREAFLSLCGEPKTQARMQHMLTTGKPLRN
ncbi:3-hydroxyacyl-CoA dehydrogenase/enoyl-CoA hydratase family protein [Alkalicoccobacillus porphyridii]|uniref:3-hydroxyacyl-CoA dehydrogenase n=1 Tax=Alkalicoccobacillus porphyridii TaxID=2597270 RepID=A0A553ZWZ2_9BACI|nr:3-hydroxyacyl-CoA dehydrogenase/enoyl-CoA hydratase family protein [Alkalicoccobacillus porphyridii]TSB45980.1 3-hydroxyacyl-CoA dehydrogenase [Alkalicoccobacillus porphyridii]